ncbi:DUF6587 family protein [Ralstonia pseudosolanacearum]|uniref:Uncharacterized protein n=1 Tax=Ralstonia solanacearum TaxID=305 RepID=A0AA92K5E9_RALSL|nr:DUF6587 family protein [Ralstonia pseudosolanacearum]QOK98907.1 hypothetical protein HF909_21080 [Ralstonia pseudosolanacearum]UWD88145.1 hypothetical protein NY025_05335 [Ralstonia pseudosolanacearum]CAH0442213.1 hypothetical protein LMG9673_03025 [Ralstonia pseudosolanacearum]
MSVYHVVETGVVATLVALSALSITGRYAPTVRARTVARMALWCDRPSRPGWVRAVGRRLLVPGAAPSCHSDPLSGSGCGSGCSGCASGEAPAQMAEQPIRIVRHR